MTQRSLSERLYVTESTVSKWERGLSYPDVSLIPEVCRVLSITEHEFMDQEEFVAAMTADNPTMEDIERIVEQRKRVSEEENKAV